MKKEFTEVEHDVEGIDLPNSTCLECKEVTLTIDRAEGFFCGSCGLEKEG